ncbi:MAG: pyrimidine-nucleoside phosphorylase, partial [Atribacterota bacterium]|nr:pyrimidine-nucleoside phosphorylase [Atribacterota bacterium]
MDIIDLIEKKKNGLGLSENEIKFVIDEYVKGNIPDYQMSAFLMAVWFIGMSYQEIN